jgi:hypothetical protein
MRPVGGSAGPGVRRRAAHTFFIVCDRANLPSSERARWASAQRSPRREVRGRARGCSAPKPPGRCSRWYRRRGDSRDRGGDPRHHRTVWIHPPTSGHLHDVAKLRWRIERDYQELEQEVGLGHFEGRGWRGFHHHATMCIAAYGFLVSERETIPPSGPGPARLFEELAVPAGYRPHGAAVADRAPHSKFNRHHAPTPDRRTRPALVAMPVLSKSNASTFAAEKFVTQ